MMEPTGAPESCADSIQSARARYTGRGLIGDVRFSKLLHDPLLQFLQQTLCRCAQRLAARLMEMQACKTVLHSDARIDADLFGLNVLKPHSVFAILLDDLHIPPGIWIVNRDPLVSQITKHVGQFVRHMLPPRYVLHVDLQGLPTTAGTPKRQQHKGRKK